jgi:hypothetical protein
LEREAKSVKEGSGAEAATHELGGRRRHARSEQEHDADGQERRRSAFRQDGPSQTSGEEEAQQFADSRDGAKQKAEAIRVRLCLNK